MKKGKAKRLVGWLFECELDNFTHGTNFLLPFIKRGINGDCNCERITHKEIKVEIIIREIE